jgi:two-component system OmpR family response regulator
MLRRHAYASTSSQNNPTADSKELQHGDLTLSSDTYRVFWKEHALTLTTTEFNLLHTFLLSPQRCFSREALCQLDIFRDVVSDRTIDSHIRRLRGKFSALNCNTVIETVHGFGYQLGSCV